MEYTSIDFKVASPPSPGQSPPEKRRAVSLDPLLAAHALTEAGDAIVTLDHNAKVMSWNRAACRVERSRCLGAQVRAGSGFQGLCCGVAAVGDGEVEHR